MKASIKFLMSAISDCTSAGILLLLSGIYFIMPSCRDSSGDEYTVMSGSFRQTVTETGELVAINASYISMPRINYIYGYNFKIIGLAEHGKNVTKGDSIVKVDPSSIYKYIIEKQESLENEHAAATKQGVQMENNLQDLRAQLKNEQAAFDLKKLEVERFRFESENKRKVKELEFRQAEIRLARVKRSLSVQPALDSLDKKIQIIRVIQRESELAAAKETLKQMLIRSPGDGIFQVEVNRRTGQTLRVGDEIYLGAMIASIPDIKKMKVMTVINESDINKVKTGNKVIVRLDALPSVPFNGVISELSKICTEQDNGKVFKVQVRISESDLRLKPGMTVSCEFVCYESDDELFVPNKCIYTENKHSYVFLKKGGSVRKIEVKCGPSDINHTTVSGDIRSGQRLELPETVLAKIK